jgi:probable F420-dependent oxidoreductase
MADHTSRHGLKFGVHVPTCIEGMMYPVPFAGPDDLLPMAMLAERLGYDSVGGNDHMTTQRYVREQFATPPNFYELVVTLAYVAARTTRIRLATCLLVLPLRHVVVAAKQLATLDQLSGGRLLVGVGAGAYREEYQALFPDVEGVHRGQLVEEGIAALRLLFTERRASFRGRHIHFEDVEAFPKPRQVPLPILVGGNHVEVRRRVGALGDGWMPSILTPEELRAGIEDIARAAEAAGRDPRAFEIAPQFAVAIASTHEEALKRFRASQLYHHFESLKDATLQGLGGSFEERNLIGSADAICEKIRRYQDAGATMLPAITFVATTTAELMEQIDRFGRDVIPAFA